MGENICYFHWNLDEGATIACLKGWRDYYCQS